jgi:hypothetical protein
MQAINTKLLVLILCAVAAIGSAIAYQQAAERHREQVLQQKQEQLKRSLQNSRYDWDGKSAAGKFRLP